MKYMLMLYDEKTAGELTPQEGAAWFAFREKAGKAATWVASQALQPVSNATVVSVRDGRRLTTDGPFIETKEQLGGYFVFDCDNLDVALDLAAMTPAARTGHVEVRPVFEVE